MTDEDAFKKAAQIVYEVAEWRPKTEWEAIPERDKFTWYVAIARAYEAFDIFTKRRQCVDNLLSNDDVFRLAINK